MPVADTSDKETISLILFKDQAQQLRARAREQTSKYKRVGISEIAREVVDLGLAKYPAVLDTGESTSGEDVDTEAS